MAKRVKVTKHEGLVKVVDPLVDAPENVGDQSDVSHAYTETPIGARSSPSFGQRVRRFFDFLIRLISWVIILGVIGLGLYYGLPLLYQRYVVPVEQNTAGVTELQSRQEQAEQELADLQARLETMEAAQSQNTETLTELDQRLSEIETEINARTQSLAALEEIQSEIQAQNEAISAELEYKVNLLKAMELLSRARLLMYQSNFGLARQDVQMARDVLAKVQPGAPTSLEDDLDEVIRRLDLTLFNLPDFPVAARDDLDIAWQVLLSGLPQIPTSRGGTPTPAGTLSSTPNVTLTPTPRVTVEPSATP
jgi:hypothetical protein